jgi:signal transduction histidine kinase
MTNPAIRKNYLLELLDVEVLSELGFVPVQLSARDILCEPGMPVIHGYFPITAVISVVTPKGNGASAEVALVGREGMVGLSGLLGAIESPMTAIVQIPGIAVRIPITRLKATRLRSPLVRTVLDRYTQARLIQVATIAACNRLHSVDSRLARWLMAIGDRIEGAQFILPHEFLAQVLGVQHPVLSAAMHRLIEVKAIRCQGPSIVIDERSRLESMACECYGVLRREFDRLRCSAIEGGVSDFAEAPSTNDRGESAAALETMRQIASRLLLANLREQKAREDAEAANRTKEQFLAMVSHELRTPLNVILGWCALLRGPRKGSVERGLQIIQQNATVQLKLVEDLLDAVRLVSSTLTIRRVPINLREIVENAVEAAKPMAQNKQVTIGLAIVDELSPLIADADRLRQVFSNVVSNAVKFTDVGGSVQVLVTAVDGTARVTIRDTGRGIGPEMLSHVFERFRQGTPATSGSQGLGLGLTIAQAIVELHGGSIQLASPGEGLGTTCTIDLPTSMGS